MSNSELQQFNYLISSIYQNISLLEKRLLIIRIYSGNLLAICIFHLLISFFFIKKIVEKSLFLNPGEELINQDPNLDNGKNEENTNLKV